MKKENKKYTKWIGITGILMLAGLAGIAVLVILIDPFFHYHGPRKGFPYQIDNQISQNPGMAKNMSYDSVLLGSSMTVNFETDWFAELQGLQTLKLSYNGAYPKDIYNIMEKVKESGQPLKTVFLGVDLASYTGDVEETKYPIPDYLYNQSLFDDVNYWYNKDVLLDYMIKPVLMRDEPTPLSSVYDSHWWMEELYGKAAVLEGYTVPEKNDAYFPEDMFIEGLDNNLSANILPVIERYPDTEFILFFPPYSILYWYDYVQNNQLEAVMYEYRHFMEKLLEYDNVRLFFFPNMEETCNLDLYADTGHYTKEINRYMAEAFVSGKHEIGRDNYEEELKKMKSVIENYDYEALFSESE